MKIGMINNIQFNGMVNKDITLKQRYGLHIRPSGYFAKLAMQANGDVVLFNRSKGNETSGKSIIGIMTLEAVKGDKLTLSVDDKIIKEQPKLYAAMVNYLDSNNYLCSAIAAAPFIKDLQDTLDTNPQEFDKW